MNRLSKFLIAVVGCELVGLLATPFTINAIPSWYQFLNKPPFSPPNWIFAPVWIILYFMMGVSVYLILIENTKKKAVKNGLLFFSIQLFLNFIWSLIFFGLKNPLLAFIEIIFLWIFILLSIIKFYKINNTASYLLIPYLLWVSFASVLNLSIILLN